MKVPFNLWMKVLPVIVRYMETRRLSYCMIGGVAFHILTSERVDTKDIDLVAPSFKLSIDSLRDLANYLQSNGLFIASSRLLDQPGGVIAQVIVGLEPPYLLGVEVFTKIYGKSAYPLFKDVQTKRLSFGEINVVSPASYIALILSEPSGIRGEDIHRIEEVAEKCSVSPWSVAEKLSELNLLGIASTNLVDQASRGGLTPFLEKLSEILGVKK